MLLTLSTLTNLTTLIILTDLTVLTDLTTLTDEQLQMLLTWTSVLTLPDAHRFRIATHLGFCSYRGASHPGQIM